MTQMAAVRGLSPSAPPAGEDEPDSRHLRSGAARAMAATCARPPPVASWSQSVMRDGVRDLDFASLVCTRSHVSNRN